MMCDLSLNSPKNGEKNYHTRPDHILITVLLISAASCVSCTSLPLTTLPNSATMNDPFQTYRLMTSRVLITVEGRDESRHLTTYRVRADDPTSELNFGFPPQRARDHDEERMVLFDADAFSSVSQDIHRVTLSHPLHEVYLTSDGDQSVRACVYGESSNIQRNSYICRNSPYIYLESVRNPSSSNGDRFKIRFLVDNGKPTGHRSSHSVAYIHVSPFSWELRLRTQVGLIIQALAAATQEAWNNVLTMLFERQVRLFEERRKYRMRAARARRRKCAQTPVSVRDQLIASSSEDYFRREIRNALRSEQKCMPNAFNASSEVNKFRLTASKPWKTMTREEKALVVSCVGQVVCSRLQQKLLQLGKNPCFRKRRWGRLSQRKRIDMLKKHLTVAWLRKRTEIDTRIVRSVDDFLDAKTTTFVIRRLS